MITRFRLLLYIKLTHPISVAVSLALFHLCVLLLPNYFASIIEIVMQKSSMLFTQIIRQLNCSHFPPLRFRLMRFRGYYLVKPLHKSPANRIGVNLNLFAGENSRISSS